MNINQLVNIIKQKIESNIVIKELQVEDKSFLHKKHKNFNPKRFHIKIKIKTDEFKSLSKIEATRKIYSFLEDELKNHIHSLEILFI
tara:strand:- start:1059 stop:1319 length:261 start_codon:yes stop_codon:yes gene_type:complete